MMKRSLLVLTSAFLFVSCTPSLSNVLTTGVNVVTSQISVTNKLPVITIKNNSKVDLVQATLVVTASWDFVSKPECKLQDTTGPMNIYGCNIGSIKAGAEKKVDYIGTVKSGTLFGYDAANNFYPVLLK